MAVASIQFDINDPKVQRVLLKIAADLASTKSGRVGMGTGGKFIIEAVLGDPAMLAKIMAQLDAKIATQDEEDIASAAVTKRKK